MTYGNVSDTSGVAGDVEDHSRKDDRRKGRVEALSIVRENSASTEGEEVEGNRGEDEGGGHTGDGPAGDTTASSAVNDSESDESKDEAAKEGE